MVAVLVADDNALQRNVSEINCPQTPLQLAQAETGVNQDASAVAVDQHGVATAATA